MNIPQSHVIDGRFQITEPMGGNMSEVYKAIDTAADPVSAFRRVALKLVKLRTRTPAEGSTFDNIVERFQREIDIVTKLENPGLPRFIAAGEDPRTALPYLAMEFIDGDLLSDLVGERLPMRFATGIAGQLADVLHAAHLADVLHRDIKPNNAMLEPSGRVKLLDFGIGHFLDAPDLPKLTATGVTVGTVRYMSPEQVRGRELTVRSDLYGLGCLLYELLGGAPPFVHGTAYEIQQSHVAEPPPPIEMMRADLPQPLVELVNAMLAKSPSDRPADAEAVADRLREIALAAPMEPLPADWNFGDPAAILTRPADTGSTMTFVEPTSRVTRSQAATDGGMNVFELHSRLVTEYRRFTSGGVIIKNSRIRQRVQTTMDDGEQWPAPYVSLNPAFASGGRVDELADTGVLHLECARIFQSDKSKQHFDGTPITLHRHQREAIEVARSGESYVLTTGTGSGKSLSYIVPIVDKVLRDRAADPAPRIRAIVVYPMNALANSQKQELEKYLSHGYPDGAGPVSFARYTGQESQSDRDAIRRNPPDILLTNYMMLELLLTRPDDRKALKQIAAGLEFLVFDELHTYRGRQGADVAWLIRRVKSTLRAPDVQCVGTSATMSTEGSLDDQRAAVAKVATTLFGTRVDPGDVIGETLIRGTRNDSARPTATRVKLPLPPRTHAELVNDPLAAWIESHFGIRYDGQRLVRQAPITVEGAAETLSGETGVDQETCEVAIRDTLLAGSAARDPSTNRPLFAFRLHQFISKGDSVYVTLEPESSRHITREYQVEQPASGGKLLLPVSFCRDCGQEYLIVRRLRDTATGRHHYRPNRDAEVVDSDEIQTGYLYISKAHPWPSDPDEVMDKRLLPESWLEVDQHGNPRVKPHFRKRMPLVVQVNPQGREGYDGVTAAFLPGSFRFCLAPDCRISHEKVRGKDFGKLAALNQEGRSSATSLLSATIVESLRSIPDARLDSRAKKLLSFVDNRQDAALQAGHFNDFVQVVQLRSALVQSLKNTEDGELDSSDLGKNVAKAMGLSATDLTGKPEQVSALAKRARSTFDKLLDFRLHLDLEQGWRVTMPNLEQTGLLSIDYVGLAELAGNEQAWDTGHDALRHAEPLLRQKIMRAVLDEMRRQLAIDAECLEPDEFESLRRATINQLAGPWQLDETDKPVQSIVYPMASTKSAAPECVFMSGMGKVGRYLRRVLDPTLKRPDLDKIITDLLTTLTRAGLVNEETPRSRRPERRRGPSRPDATGYRVSAGAIIWQRGDGRHGVHDPLVATRDKDNQPPVNRYFKELYERSVETLSGLHAHEHTAQVNATDREDREHRFRDGELPLLYCSPTMELGVDISSLNAVLMRNVPPTPANYAQRSGRAGRSGQQALVVTYCATGNSHDQYYFKKREQMVSGSVAPPRLDLCNEDLIRSHVQAIWLAEAGLGLGQGIGDLVNTTAVDADDGDTDAAMPLESDITKQVSHRDAQARTVRIAEAMLNPLEPVLRKTTWWTEDWLSGVVSKIPGGFDRAFDRWRGLYRSARENQRAHNKRRTDYALKTSEHRDARSRRDEAEIQLDLLRNSGPDRNTMMSDFNPYRYLASEGFLPGYSFPRLPLAAYIPKSGPFDGDYLQRPRFLAIREFGPEALIYHEGSRYQVTRVQLTPDSGGELPTTSTKRCPGCGYWHKLADKRDMCELCHSPIGDETDNLLHLHTVYTQKRERISSDEEERRRARYKLVTSYRFSEHGERDGRFDARIRDADGDIGVVSYGDAASVRVTNLRRMRSGPDERDGYLIDRFTGDWLSKKQADDAVTDVSELADADDGTRVSARVIPYVQDTRNIAVLRLAERLTNDRAMSLMYALERGIETTFELEDSELSAELPAGDDHPTEFLLFVESAEGGAGVLRRLQDEPDALARAAREALRICHVDPDTGVDESTACARGCYDCLLSYSNQHVHDAIDRRGVVDLLRRLATATALTAAGGQTRTDQHQSLAAPGESSLEREFRDWLKAKDYRLPNQSQYLVESARARPDFVYRLPSQDVAVFVDGPHHDSDRAAERDAAAAERLDLHGWDVVRFSHRVDWDDVARQHISIFGIGRQK